ncbi:MAG: hypothetical protein M5U22_08970 [Thermoleophilia bacterium]|nr:hypothetical protein [Thermoleophilia bacterium]
MNGESGTRVESLGLIDGLFRTLARQGVRHCVFKSVEHLAESLRGESDIDLLVDGAHRQTCREALSSLEFRRVVSQPWARYPGIEDWVGLDAATGRLVHVHLHFQLHSGLRFVKHLHLPWEEVVLDSAAAHPVYYVPVIDPALELVLIVVRMAARSTMKEAVGSLLRGWSIERTWRKELAYLWERADPEMVERYARRLLSPPVAAEVARLAASGELPTPAGLFGLRARLAREPRMRRLGWGAAYAQYAYRRLIRFGARKERRFLRSGRVGKRLEGQGLVVALVGSDGAGKSTIARELEGRLGNKLDVQRHYMGRQSGPALLVHRALRRLAKRLGRSLRAGDAPLDISTGMSGVGFALQRSLLLRWSLRAAGRGSLVVLDRYPQGHIRGSFDGPMLRPDGRKVGPFSRVEDSLYRVIERQGGVLLFRLRVSPEVAKARKPEESMEVIDRKAATLDSLRFGKGVTVVDIDADRPIAEVVAQIEAEIWRRL